MGAKGQISLMQFIEYGKAHSAKASMVKSAKKAKCIRWFRKEDSHTFLKRRNVKCI